MYNITSIENALLALTPKVNSTNLLYDSIEFVNEHFINRCIENLDNSAHKTIIIKANPSPDSLGFAMKYIYYRYMEMLTYQTP